VDAATDPVRARRQRIGRLAATARRLGFALFALALLVVVVGLFTSLTGAVTAVATACLVAGSVLLAPAIVIGYGVSAAERDDRARRR
jgi:membrane-bound ClpP family serine protease